MSSSSSSSSDSDSTSDSTSDSESSSSSESEIESDEEMEVFRQQARISYSTRHKIRQIKNNDPDTIDIDIKQSTAVKFTNQAWQSLGRYIANNTHLTQLSLDGYSITDEKMSILFGELTNSRSLQTLNIIDNDFGVEGVRSMVPFLNSSPQLTKLTLRYNNEIDTECFDLVVSSLHNTCIQELSFMECNITNISSLETYSLSNLQKLNLNGNEIGRKGCIIISNLLQKEGSALTELDLLETDIDDEGAEILAASLKNNTKLKVLRLQDNDIFTRKYLQGNDDITQRGCLSFLTLLVNVSSIDSTYKSNHTLMQVFLCGGDHNLISFQQREAATRLNRLHHLSSHAAGRAKVIEYQLNSQKRKLLCQLQGIEFSYSNIFADIEPILLPNVIALIGERQVRHGERHGQSELYTALIHTAPDLLSYVDRRALLKEEKDRNAVQRAQIAKQVEELTRQLDVLVAEDDRLNNRLALIELGDRKASVVDGGKENSSGEKRQRIR